VDVVEVEQAPHILQADLVVDGSSQMARVDQPLMCG
jgi:hypothetical protein